MNMSILILMLNVGQFDVDCSNRGSGVLDCEIGVLLPTNSLGFFQICDPIKLLALMKLNLLCLGN